MTGWLRLLTILTLITSHWVTEASILGEPVPISEFYFRTLSWFSPRYGLVASITSEETATPPPDTFATAGSFQRLISATGFRDNIPPVLQPGGGLTIEQVGENTIELRWPDFAAGATSFQIERLVSLESNSWEVIHEQTGRSRQLAVEPGTITILRIVAIEPQ